MEIFDYFKDQFKDPIINRPRFESSNFKKLTENQSSFLQQPFTDEEIIKAASLCGGEKAPGPDGFTFNFTKANWEYLKCDIFATVRNFEATGRFGMGCNSSFIALIPKVKDLLLILDFRPISLMVVSTK